MKPSSQEGYLLISWHLGLGDTIACRAIVKNLAVGYRMVFVGAKAHNLPSVRALFQDLTNVHVMNLGKNRPDFVQKIRKLAEMARGTKVVNLGFGGTGYLVPPFPYNFDENFFVQAGVPFSERVEGDSFPRNLGLERELETALGGLEEPFVFVHDDPGRGIEIDPLRIPSDIRVIHAHQLSRVFPITAWVGVLLKAAELHVIESSFAALIESVNPPGRKVAHRYARQFVLEHPQMEWTYQTSWEIER